MSDSASEFEAESDVFEESESDSDEFDSDASGSSGFSGSEEEDASEGEDWDELERSAAKVRPTIVPILVIHRRFTEKCCFFTG
jgi:nucleosome binding factor SPN SPT16 subunit